MSKLEVQRERSSVPISVYTARSALCLTSMLTVKVRGVITITLFLSRLKPKVLSNYGYSEPCDTMNQLSLINNLDDIYWRSKVLLII